MTQSVNDFYQGKTAIITGASSGIGKALCQQLHQLGCNVALADIDGDIALTLAAQLDVKGTTALAYAVDVRDHTAVNAMVNAAYKHFGRLDFIFNNAGIAVGGPVFEYDALDWQRVFDVNVTGVTNGIDAAYPIMRKQGFGHIINTSSVASLFPNVLTAAYSASKSAVTTLSQILQVEAKPFGIHVHVLLPGPVDTPILTGGKYGRGTKGLSAEKLRRYWQRMRPISAEDCAQQALIGIAQNKHRIIIPKRWNWLSWSYRICLPFWYKYANNAILNRQKTGLTTAEQGPESPPQ